MSNRKLFISYRRQDHAVFVKLIRQLLLQEFEVFFDETSIDPGQMFPQAIRGAICQCDAMIVIIGPQWMELLDPFEPEKDYVQKEIGLALEKGKVIAPIRILNASFPTKLPPNIRPLLDCEAYSIPDSGPSFENNVKTFMIGLNKTIDHHPKQISAVERMLRQGRYTRNAHFSIELAYDAASQDAYCYEIGTIYLLLGLMRNKDSVAGEILRGQLHPIKEKEKELQKWARQEIPSSGLRDACTEINFSTEVVEILTRTIAQAEKSRNKHVTSEHLLYALACHPEASGMARTFLERSNILEKVCEECQKALGMFS